MNKNQSEYELIRLWLLVTEGLASEDDLQQLNRMLEADADARKCLFHLTRQQSWLIWNGATAPGLAGAVLARSQAEVEAARAQFADCALAPIDSGLNRRSTSGALESVVSRSKAAFSSLRAVRIPLVSYRMAALAACIAVAAGWIAHNYDQPQAVHRTDVAGEVRAEVIGATVCVWSGGVEGTPSLGHQFHEGDTLQLLEGVAELRIHSSTSDAELQLEGPVAVVIGSNGISNLRFGKVAIQTSTAGAGFQVATSFGRVVAGPGAEIGISTFGNSAEVHVFEGTVALESPWIVSDDGELAIRHIHADEAVRLNQAGESALQVSDIAPDRGLFTTRLSMDANFLRVTPNYIRAVRAAEPVAYWRFEEAEAKIVHNEMGAKFQGTLRGDYRWVGPEGSRAIEFGVAPNPGAMQVPESWDAVLAKDFSCEFWMRPSHYHLGTILGFAGPFDHELRKNIYGINVEIQGGWGDGARTNRVRFLNRAPLSQFSPGTSLFSTGRYATRRWQHVVAVRKGSDLSLYLDGELVQTGRLEIATPKGLQLVVGQLYTESLARPFIGYLDELAIYDRALGEEEVEEHYRLIRSEAKTRNSI
jgi:hypothetical protein